MTFAFSQVPDGEYEMGEGVGSLVRLAFSEAPDGECEMGKG